MSVKPSMRDLTLVADTLAMIRELANGFKRQLEEDGWSPTAAEQCAMAFVISALMGDKKVSA